MMMLQKGGAVLGWKRNELKEVVGSRTDDGGTYIRELRGLKSVVCE